MGEALLAGWLAARPAGRTRSMSSSPTRRRRRQLAATRASGRWPRPAHLPPDLARPARAPAVKPQMMDAALPAYRERVGRRHAGPLDRRRQADRPFRAGLRGRRPVVRAMPNTPAAVGRGITVLCANAGVGAGAACAGRAADGGGRRDVHWVEDEELMHAVTAVSGGGPAYVFLLIEALAAAGAGGGPAGGPGDAAGARDRHGRRASWRGCRRRPRGPASART